jgi:hypothetical protein
MSDIFYNFGEAFLPFLNDFQMCGSWRNTTASHVTDRIDHHQAILA